MRSVARTASAGIPRSRAASCACATQAGIWLLDNADRAATVAEPGSPVPIGESGLPEAAPGDFDAGGAAGGASSTAAASLSAAWPSRDEAASLASAIDGALEAREQGSNGAGAAASTRSSSRTPASRSPTATGSPKTGASSSATRRS